MELIVTDVVYIWKWQANSTDQNVFRWCEGSSPPIPDAHNFTNEHLVWSTLSHTSLFLGPQIVLSMHLTSACSSTCPSPARAPHQRKPVACCDVDKWPLVIRTAYPFISPRAQIKSHTSHPESSHGGVSVLIITPNSMWQECRLLYTILWQSSKCPTTVDPIQETWN